MTDHAENEKPSRRIEIMKNSSYHIFGNLPLVCKKQVVSEFGEPLTWEKDNEDLTPNIEGRAYYSLCRCGFSERQPFCDGLHRKFNFDGSESADTGSSEMRAEVIPGGTNIVVMLDESLCMDSGFCGLRDADIDQLVAGTSDTKIRSLVIAMVERCPSGALTYRIEPDGEIIEPDLPQQIALTIEITSEGAITGPLWVSGNIPILRSDGEPFETRNRVTLCNCGRSYQKPLCDGTHREIQEQALKKKKDTESKSDR